VEAEESTATGIEHQPRIDISMNAGKALVAMHGW
jgi:hypothetical protein